MKTHSATLMFIPFTLLSVFVAACSDRPAAVVDAGSQIGSPGGPCSDGGTCHPGLVCQNGHCQSTAKIDGAALIRDGGGPLDQWSPAPEGGSLPDHGPLFACADVGKACNPHDPCAIDPICGTDYLCHPTDYQDCRDSLSCTKDICKGMGLCENVPEDGYCVLSDGTQPAACFMSSAQSTSNPCLICMPSISPVDWWPANGGACDDNDPCTKEDYCQSGVCHGTSYGEKCSDKLDCTEDLCDGIGGCLEHKLKPGYCLIGGACYADGDKDSSGCNVCDVSKSTSDWTKIC